MSDVYDALSNERRRRVLSALSEETTPVDVAELAHTVATAETADRPRGTPDEHVTQVHTSLHHVHLPKLTDLGLVEYDPDAETVDCVVDVNSVLA
ncbi:hypothetical protein ACFOZ7_06270 [Natribaculum luteum]|uniref:DUF7344 domain-containing protein n=1 Tax=Natribaculum luteum TaxID=1586232 RepID=A0ABD5NXR1_9EURY|nr:hypothetical protein [Natribaculum luteum]